ncbi:RTL1 [Branchiostoma lanceolatum]|uniref:Gypsy retrotransposon integrase-like protein 1 n=1 Tax=Branchiostoma lanceolatum TaxID=7740 RepID=A0A8K0EG49_BRALA|nr:RTL1 [Branchiostoma lanceolatum]
MTKSCFDSKFGARGEKLKPDSSWLKLTAMNGLPIKLVGCAEMDIQIMGKRLPKRGVLVVEDNPAWVTPAILGMNVISSCRSVIAEAIEKPEPEQTEQATVWSRALKVEEKIQRFTVAEDGRVGAAWAPHREKLIIPAGHEMIIFCKARTGPNRVPYTVLVEPPEAGTLPKSILVARAYAEVRHGRVPVRVANVAEYDVTLGRRARLGELYLVERVPEQAVELEDDPTDSLEAHVRVVTGEFSNEDAPSTDSDDTLPVNVDADLTNLTGEQVQKLRALLTKHKNTFSRDKHDFGRTNIVTHRIPTGTAPPSREPYRRIPPALRAEVKEHINMMLDQDVIRPSSSPWASPVVLIRKKDGGLRFCVDYRKLNAVTHRDAFPLPRIEESLDALGGARLFSTLDLSAGFWQIEMDEADREKTAFTCPYGLFEFNRTPFGLSGSPGTMQRLMQRCLGDQNLEILLIYLDDIIVFSKDVDEHLARLDVVLSRLGQYGLKLRPDKCHLFRTSVKYLGHIVSEEGVSTDPDKTVALRDWPVPTTVRQVRQFLGFASYYRRFVESFGKIAGPLHELVRKDQPFVWTPACQSAFDTLREKLTTAPLLAYPDYSQPFLLYTDASNQGLGAVLAQKQDGVERVIAYASRGLRPAERNWDNYSSFKLELLALKWAVTEKFKEHLYGNEVIIYTDNNPLAHLPNAVLGAVEQRWVARLSTFNHIIKYRPGKSNANADALSRMPTHEARVSALMAQETDQGGVHLSELLKKKRRNKKRGDPEKVEELGHAQGGIRTLQQEDPVLERVIRYVRKGQRPTAKEVAQERTEVIRILRQWNRLELREGVLCRLVWGQGHVNSACQVVLPAALRKEAFEAIHTNHGHLGTPKTLGLARQRFYWVGMDADLTTWVKTCERCCLRKTPVPHVRPPLVNIRVTAPLELVAMDYVTVEKSSSGYENILVITDHFTKYSVAIPTKNQTAQTTAKSLWRQFILPYGFPKKLHSDQGANFQSELIRELCKLYGAAKISTTPYHPAGNGQCERFNRTLLDLLGTLEVDKKRRWPDYISQLVHAYNNAPHSSTGYSPYYMMFGRHARLPWDVTQGVDSDIEEGEPSANDWVREHHERYQYAYAQAQKRLDEAAATRKRIYDKTAKEAPLLPGERVLVSNKKCRGRKKIQDRWERLPYIVREQPDAKVPVYIVEPVKGNGPTRKLHRQLMIPCLFGPTKRKRAKRDQHNTSVDELSDPQMAKPPVESPPDTPSESFDVYTIPSYLFHRESGETRETDGHGKEVTIETDPGFHSNPPSEGVASPEIELGEANTDPSPAGEREIEPSPESTMGSVTGREGLTPPGDPVDLPRYPIRVNRGRPPNWYGNPILMGARATCCQTVNTEANLGVKGVLGVLLPCFVVAILSIWTLGVLV